MKRPLPSFFFLTYSISWAIWLPIVIYYYASPFPISFAETPAPLILLALLGFFGPTFSALILAGLENGGRGIQSLLSGWKKWRVGLPWYLVILISQIVIELLATLLYILFTGVRPELNWSAWFLLFPMFLQAAIIGGAIAEETGWRGFALPKLLKTRSALASAVIIGVIWGAWHLPISLVPGANFPIPLNPALILVFLLSTTVISIVMTWLYINTGGSIFIGYLYHAMLNTSLFGAIFHFADFGSAWWVRLCISTALRGVFALFLIAYFGANRLSRKSEISIGASGSNGE
jgi:membrane protease YdiL (CAAX protease family)